MLVALCWRLVREDYNLSCRELGVEYVNTSFAFPQPTVADLPCPGPNLPVEGGQLAGAPTPIALNWIVPRAWSNYSTALDDDSTEVVGIGFPFSFYGQWYVYRLVVQVR